ncbi:IS3 family transposase [Pectobacterium brasiliense]|uniref:IS3 family transposase n=1 Tax=Pectobacterium brasiliense TaxID=180957 RepID=UPI00196A1553|nr:IS3 family transposase [Pectobacterium brasiliense]
MKKSRFTESQIVAVLKEGEAGVPVAELCRKHGISSATYYNWKSKYSGVEVSELQRLRELEAENARLKRMYADLALENAAIKDVLNRKFLTPSARREVVEQLVHAKLSIMHACQLAGLSRAAYYKRPRPASERDAEVIDALNAIVTRHGRWGFWKCFSRLRLDGHGWNKKRVHRVYCDMGLNLPRRTRKRLQDRPRQPLDLATEINRCWALDFMHDALYCGRRFRTLNVIDEANRECLTIEVGTSIPSARLIRVLNRLVDYYGSPDAIRLDNGPEMISGAFTEWAARKGIAIRYIQPGKPNQNAFIERFNRTYRTEVLDAHLFANIEQVQAITDQWLMDYNEYRPHESLGGLPPVLFMHRSIPVPDFYQTMST